MNLSYSYQIFLLRPHSSSVKLYSFKYSFKVDCFECTPFTINTSTDQGIMPYWYSFNLTLN